MSDKNKVFQYVQLKSVVSPDFWYKLAETKLNIEKLNENSKNIFGSFTNFNSQNCVVNLDCTAFNSHFKPRINSFHCHGTLLNRNTIESFKDSDKAELLKKEGEQLIDNIVNGLCLEDPTLLVPFILLSYADLKKYNFYYWFAFPASIDPVFYENSTPQKLVDVFPQQDIANFNDTYRNFEDQRLVSFFLCNEKLEIKLLKDLIRCDNLEGNLKEVDLNLTYFSFSDPSEYENPAWPLRNFVFMLLKLCPNLIGKQIKVISVRQDSKRTLTPSLIFTLDLQAVKINEKDEIKWTGWERNNQGKLLPKMSSMGESMDPEKLSDHFSNLNLKLMKWRLLPNLNLDVIKSQKCLLFGAGTLGCAIARNLLSWGVSNITFVDYGNVAFSNPVRQNLFTHDDAVKKKPKAIAAAERLKEILPHIKASGHVLQIPMPGHIISDSMRQKTIENIHQIKQLVESHDVMFLLTDSRESRWLPTLLGASFGKIVITTALGFDSYLVMRHGGASLNEVNDDDMNVPGLKCISGCRLGCYFCNDITAPGNSMKDRTLDQQCTVTRPGVSNISSAIAVELLVSILQHEKKHSAPAYYQMSHKDADASIPEGILGIVPHSIRGYLNNFEHILPATERFSQCIACSEKVLKEFEKNGEDFLLRVFNSAEYLEEITGIDKIAEVDNAIIDCDDFDIDSE
ncbi:CLUMA_CG006505, isoform A [Clunio marinus]|uniref:Ubiquitin-like modifier-activating enzyme ATG7 n=1 Tax=Clunio marinus TaxID=568069 RepID=A0A1J1HY84_9DIPT|nr:CLUMA_CG006505, isoform A [Clunio marinus]